MNYAKTAACCVLGVAALATGCSQIGIETPEAPEAVVSAVGNAFIRAPLMAGPAGGTISGGVEVIDIPTTRDMQIQVNVSGLSAGPHAWHIHSGPCGQQAPVVVPFTPTAQMQGLDDPIVAGADGNAEEGATIPSEMLTRQQLEAGAYSLHIHTMAGVDHGPTAACANLR